MDISLLLLLINFTLALGAPRKNVHVRGTTFSPDLRVVQGRPASHCPEDHPISISDATKCCSDFRRSSNPVCQAMDYSNKTRKIISEDPEECCMGSLVDCKQEAFKNEKCRDHVDMVSLACPSEFRYAYDYGRRCCVKDLKDDNPGPECQNVANPTIEYLDHADCCSDSTKCPKDNGICEKNESEMPKCPITHRYPVAHGRFCCSEEEKDPEAEPEKCPINGNNTLLIHDPIDCCASPVACNQTKTNVCQYNDEVVCLEFETVFEDDPNMFSPWQAFDLETCRDYCKDYPPCKYWSLDLTTHFCQLKETRTRPIFKIGVVSGSSDCALPNCFETNIFYGNAEEIAEIPDIDMIVCHQECVANGQCGMISYKVKEQLCYLFSNEHDLGQPIEEDYVYSASHDCPLMSEYKPQMPAVTYVRDQAFTSVKYRSPTDRYHLNGPITAVTMTYTTQGTIIRFKFRYGDVWGEVFTDDSDFPLVYEFEVPEDNPIVQIEAWKPDDQYHSALRFTLRDGTVHVKGIMWTTIPKVSTQLRVDCRFARAAGLYADFICP